MQVGVEYAGTTTEDIMLFRKRKGKKAQGFRENYKGLK
jgi:hypothetical protein